MDCQKLLVTNIQRFSLHDGPGIRTTVFLKGCSLCCPWCANPENLSFQQQKYVKNGIEGIYGRFYNINELVEECLKDKAFYEGNLLVSQWNIKELSKMKQLPGGVTFSGGECLLQMNNLAPVCQTLKDENVHLVAETSLFCSEQNLLLAMEYIDLFYVDMKIIDADRCEQIEKGNIDLYLSNLDRLLNSVKYIPVIIRIPVIGSYTDDISNRNNVKSLIKRYADKILKIELIKEHNMANSKYQALNMQSDYHGVSDELMLLYRDEIKNVGVYTEVCKV